MALDYNFVFVFGIDDRTYSVNLFHLTTSSPLRILYGVDDMMKICNNLEHINRVLF
jgi:hypothetical protein